MALFSQENLKNKTTIQADSTQPATDKIQHTMYRCRIEDKERSLIELLKMLDCERALIFIRTRNDVNQLVDKLNQLGFSSESIHNEISQKKRKERLNAFKSKQFKFLVATDIAARGIDITDLYYVINYDLPVNSNDYIHRVGRTARRGISKENISIEVSKQKEIKSAVPVAPWDKSQSNKNSTAGIQGHIFSLVSSQQERLVEKISKAVGKNIKVEKNPFI